MELNYVNILEYASKLNGIITVLILTLQACDYVRIGNQLKEY
jgi:hypothetical protein